jgi:superfamily II DNA/RNA helicase
MHEKPSIIQAQSIPLIVEKRDQNFIFQSKNGSGKTGAFAVPAVMTVDPTINDY